jgi:predicted Fe-S protein YdhL (DUF1289 family)
MCKLAALNGECQTLADNPCVGWCTTRQWGDERCKGCGRLESEISYWSQLTNVEKKLINIRNAGDGYNIRQCVPIGWRPSIRTVQHR